MHVNEGGCNENRARPFSDAQCKAKTQWVQAGIHFFIVCITEYWHRLLKEVVESPSLEIFQSSCIVTQKV